LAPRATSAKIGSLTYAIGGTNRRQFGAIRTEPGNLRFAQDCVVGPGALAPMLTVLAIFQSATFQVALSGKRIF
jgi:hypothetical protein